MHPKAETVHGEQGYASLADIPDQDIKVIDCFVNSEHVGAVVDQAIEHKDRLQIDASGCSRASSTRQPPTVPARPGWTSSWTPARASSGPGSGARAPRAD